MTEDKIERIFARIADDLNITDEQYVLAEKKYKDIGKFIDGCTPNETIELYPQGSFALKTIIKPVDREDEYDLDFVCEFKKHSFPDNPEGAKELKSYVQSLLDKYDGKCEITEKRRCWQVTYENCQQFHMDIIPAIDKKDYIDITNQQENDKNKYEFIGSNPKGYIAWFQEKQKKSYQKLFENVKFQAKIADIKDYQIRTTLQKTIQILKRHRDIMFQDDKNNCKPISIIITTIAADLYKHEPRIIDTIKNFLDGVEGYLNRALDASGEYVIKNPTYTGGDEENFADKWIIHPERKDAFFKWIKQAKKDFDFAKIKDMTIAELGQYLKKILGEKSGIRVFEAFAKEYRQEIEKGKYKVESGTGTISDKGNVNIPKVHHYGKIST